MAPSGPPSELGITASVRSFLRVAFSGSKSKARIHHKLRDKVPTYLSERSNRGQPKRGNAAKGGDRGYDAAKRSKGRKRHIVVDLLGLILAVAVTGASCRTAMAASWRSKG